MVAQGRRYIGSGVAERLAAGLADPEHKPPHRTLSEREFQVFLRLAQGQTIGHTADGMALSVKTVSTYRARVMEKMGLASNSELTCSALKNGLIEERCGSRDVDGGGQDASRSRRSTTMFTRAGSWAAPTIRRPKDRPAAALQAKVRAPRSCRPDRPWTGFPAATRNCRWG